MIYRIVCCVIDTARIGQRSSVRLPVRPYVRLSVCSIVRQQQRPLSGLLLGARREAISIDWIIAGAGAQQQRAPRRPQHGAQQQMWAASLRKPTQEAEHRLVSNRWATQHGKITIQKAQQYAESCVIYIEISWTLYRVFMRFLNFFSNVFTRATLC